MSATTMEGRYKLELRERDPATVEDLILDNCKGTEISGLDDKLVNLQSLSMINVGLTSMKGLPKLPALAKLDVSNNKLSKDLDVIAENCPQLLHLNLSNNTITDINVLSVFKSSALAELDLFSNELGSEDTYREKIFELVPSLQILDGCDVNGEEVDDDLSSNGEGSLGEDVSDEGGSDEDDVGLSYLDNSQLDEDESEDFNPEVVKAATGKKRAAEEGVADEPEAKKEAKTEDK